MPSAIAKFLSQSVFFAAIGSDLRARLEADLEILNLEPGATLFRTGDEGDAVYFVLSGAVRLEANGVQVVSRGVGECVGEFALIDASPRSATALVGEATDLIRWPRAAFRRALEEQPAIATACFSLLTGKLREAISDQVAFLLEEQQWRLEMQWAREVQLGLLPAPRATFGRVEVAGHCSPARDVGGDFYDYLALGGQADLGVVIGDVTGHGFYSALLAAMAKSCLHTQVQIDPSPPAVMKALRRTVDLSLGRRLLMSCAYVFLHEDSELRYANSGHPPLLHYRFATKRVERLTSLDPILGVLPDQDCLPSEESIRFEPGDLLVMYTDGLIETRGVDGEQLGIEWLEALLAESHQLSATAWCESVIDRLNQYRRDEDPDDDLTLVVLRHGQGAVD